MSLIIRRLVYFLFTVCLAAIAVPCLSQSNLRLESLNIKDGLSQGYVTNILQDQEGFMWFSTRNGLNRYDGHRFKIFTNDPLDPYSIAGNIVLTVHEMGEFLLIGMQGHGINLYHKKTQRFLKLRSEGELDQWLFSFNCPIILSDQDNNIWCRIKNPNENQYKIIKFRLPENINSIVEKNILIKNPKYWEIQKTDRLDYEPYANKIWGCTSRNIFSIDCSTDKFEFIDFEQGNSTIAKAYATSDGTVWVAKDHQIGKLSNKKWEWIETDFSIRNLYFFDSEKQVFISTKDDQLLLADISENKDHLNQLKNAGVLIPKSNGRIERITIDRSGIIWIGTTGYGIIKLNLNDFRFKIDFSNESIMSSVAVDNNGHYAFYSNGYNNFIFNEPNHILSNFKNSKKAHYTLKASNNGDYWLLETTIPGVNIYLKKKNENNWIKKISIPSIGKSFSWENSSFFIDQQQRIVLAQTFSLSTIDISTGEIKRSIYEGILPQRHRIYDLAKTAGNTWWISTNMGLVKAIENEKGFDFELLEVKQGEYETIQSNRVTGLLTDPTNDRILWIGTIGGGLSRLETEKMKFTHYNIKNGLSNNVIYGIQADENNCLWMSSNKGIIYFNPATKSFKNYTVEDGLPANEFNSRASAKGPNGRIFFGCVAGLVSFNPSDFHDNQTTPTTVVSRLEVNNRLVTHHDSTGILTQSIECTKKIVLPYSLNSISFELAALEYSSPSKNKFRYWLKGAEKEWAHESSEGQAGYLNLAPGNYMFIAKSCNSDGVWSKDATSIRITILPPWYRTIYAYVAYVLLFLALIYGSFRFFLHRQQLKHKLVLEQKEAERLKELDDFKSNLYTNITHEFRTPLTVIQGMANQIEEQPERWLNKGINMIKRNTANLLNLVNQMLELRKLESGTLSVFWEHGDVVEYVRYIIESFHSYAESHGLKFHFLTAHAEIKMDYDPEKLLRIVSNLLSNAVKYTPEGGHIYLQLDRKEGNIEEGLMPNLLIRVQDTGQGISPDELPYIFERFFQSEHTDKSVDSSGIGLSLVQEMVTVLGGNIEASSTVGRGSTFLVKLPIRHEANTQLDDAKEIKLPSEFFETEIETQQPATNLRQPDNLPALHIIEDNMDVAEYLSACVQDYYQVTHSMDGEEGINQAIHQVPDIIISDVMMPKKDGFEVVNILKNDERTSHIPIIMLTAKTDDASRIKGLERGADAYLAKPFIKEELLVRLRKLLELRQKLQARYSNISTSSTNEHSLASKNEPASFEDAFITKVNATLEGNLSNENFGIQELCQALGMSRTQLHNKLKALTGKSTSIYIRSFRLHKAKELLLTSSKTVSEVAFDVGFKHLQHFSSSFSEEFGTPPSQLKK